MTSMKSIPARPRASRRRGAASAALALLAGAGLAAPLCLVAFAACNIASGDGSTPVPVVLDAASDGHIDEFSGDPIGDAIQNNPDRATQRVATVLTAQLTAEELQSVYHADYSGDSIEALVADPTVHKAYAALGASFIIPDLNAPPVDAGTGDCPGAETNGAAGLPLALAKIGGKQIVDASGVTLGNELYVGAAFLMIATGVAHAGAPSLGAYQAAFLGLGACGASSADASTD
jgi:hypothetical protein